MSTYLIFLCNSLSLAHRFRSTQRVQCGEMPTNSSPTNNPRPTLNASIASEDTIGPGKNSRKKDFTGQPCSSCETGKHQRTCKPTLDKLCVHTPTDQSCPISIKDWFTRFDLSFPFFPSLLQWRASGPKPKPFADCRLGVIRNRYSF